MADIIVYGLAYLVSTTHEKYQCLRSPVLPLVADSDLHLDSPAPSTTEYQLRRLHDQWAQRGTALYLRAAVLIDAKSKGYPACWAGVVNSATLLATREAVIEADWVTSRLAAAIAWCDERKLGKMKIVHMVQVRKGRSNSVTRPTHTETPPTLLDLPFPLPEAPPSHRIALTIPRPPPLEPAGHRDEEERNRPPLYTQEADFALGESSLEGGYFYDQFEAPPAEAVVEGLDVVEYERTRT